MSEPVTLRQSEDGLWIIAPAGAPTVLDATAEIDVMVLEVLGGHLTWSLLAAVSTPAAVIDDLALAQEWIWAVYGEHIGLAIDDFFGDTMELTVQPARPELVAKAWRLGYAQWAARWWPASTIDGIAPLDERLLDKEIAMLRAECDLIVIDDDVPSRLPIEIPSRAEDYALAAGSIAENGLILERGTGGWDWRRCPPGLLDASEQAVSWQVNRVSGTTAVRVDAVAAPGAGPDIPAHLHPHALIVVGDGVAEAVLDLVGDTWTGAVTTSAEVVSSVDIYVPGVGTPGLGNVAIRQRVRDVAVARLHRATGDDTAFDSPLQAEIAAAATESDF